MELKLYVPKISREQNFTIGLDSKKMTLMSYRCLSIGSSCSSTISASTPTFLNIVSQNSGIPFTSSFSALQLTKT